MHDPETPQQWQEAVDAAAFFLAFDSARQYGLIASGMKLNLERCEKLISEGKKRGIEPAPLDVLWERYIEKRGA
jgi:hypothetical protein